MLRAGAIRAGQSPPARDAERHLTDVTSQSIIYTLYDVVQKMRLWRPYLPHHSLDPSGDPDFHAAEDEHLSDSHGSRRTSAPSLASRASTFSQVSDIRRRCVCTSTDPGLPLAPPPSSTGDHHPPRASVGRSHGSPWRQTSAGTADSQSPGAR